MYTLGVFLIAVALSSALPGNLNYRTPTVQPAAPIGQPQIEEKPQGQQPQNLIGTIPEVQAEPEPLPYELDQPTNDDPPKSTRPLPRPSQSARGSSNSTSRQFTKRELINLQQLLNQSKTDTKKLVTPVLIVPLRPTKVLFLLKNGSTVQSTGSTSEPELTPKPTLVNRNDQDINTSSGRKFSDPNANDVYIPPFDLYEYDDEQDNIDNQIYQKIYNNNYPNDTDSYADTNHSDVSQSFPRSFNISNSEDDNPDPSDLNQYNLPTFNTNLLKGTLHVNSSQPSFAQKNFDQPTNEAKLKFDIPAGHHTFLFDSGNLRYNHTDETKPIYFKQPSEIANYSFDNVENGFSNSSVPNFNNSSLITNFRRPIFFSIKSSQNDGNYGNASQTIYNSNQSTIEVNFTKPNFFTIKSIQFDGREANASQPIYNNNFQPPTYRHFNNGYLNYNRSVPHINETFLNQTDTTNFEEPNAVVTNPPYTHELYFKPRLLNSAQIFEKLHTSLNELFGNDTLKETTPYDETLNISTGEHDSPFDGYMLNESYVNDEINTKLQQSEVEYDKNYNQDLYINKIIDAHIKTIQDKLEQNATINNSTIFQVITLNPFYGLDLDGLVPQNESNVTRELFGNLFYDIEDRFLNESEDSVNNLTQNGLELFKFYIQDLINNNNSTEFNKTLDNFDEKFMERKLIQNLPEDELNQVYNIIKYLNESLLNLNDDLKSIFRNSVINQFPQNNQTNISVQIPEDDNIENYIDQIYLQGILNELNNLNSNGSSDQQTNEEFEEQLSANELFIRQLYDQYLIYTYLSSLGNETNNISLYQDNNSLISQIDNDYSKLDFPSYRGFANRVDDYTYEYYGDHPLTIMDNGIEFDPNVNFEDRSFGSPNKEIPENLRNYFAEQLYIQKLIHDFNQSGGNETYKKFLEKVYNVSFVDSNSLTNYTHEKSNIENDTIFENDFNALSNMSTYSKTISPLEQALYQLYALKFIFEYKLLENSEHNPYFTENNESNYNATLSENTKPFKHFTYTEPDKNNINNEPENITTTEITEPSNATNTRYRGNINLTNSKNTEITNPENTEVTDPDKTRPYIYNSIGYTNHTNFIGPINDTDVTKYPENIKTTENSRINWRSNDTKADNTRPYIYNTRPYIYNSTGYTNPTNFIGPNNDTDVTEYPESIKRTGNFRINWRNNDTKTDNARPYVHNTRPYIYNSTGYTDPTNFIGPSNDTDVTKYPKIIKNTENSRINWRSRDTKSDNTRPYIYSTIGNTINANFSEQSEDNEITRNTENINTENSKIIWNRKDTKGILNNDRKNTSNSYNNLDSGTTSIGSSNNSENFKENNFINKNISKINSFNKTKINFIQDSLKTINYTIDSLTQDLNFSGRNFGHSSTPDFENVEELQKLIVLLQTKKTNFDCLKRQSGFYADLDFSCKVFHRCVDGAKFTFVCGPGTLFSQEILTCDFSFKVDCQSFPQYYASSQTS